MMHFIGRSGGAPIRTFKFHKVVRAYRETPSLFRYLLGINENRNDRDRAVWMACFISSYLMPWVSRNISNEHTKDGFLRCLESMKYLLIVNGANGSKSVEICITELGESNNDY